MRRVSSILIFSSVLLGMVAAGQAQSVYRLPQIANGASLIKTTFIFINNTGHDATVTMTLTNDAGELTDMNIEGLAAGAVKVFSLPAGESRFYSSDGQGELVTGSARVASDQDIGVAAVFSLLGNGGSSLLTEAGIGASPAVTEFAIAVDTIAPFNTGVAIFNLGTRTTTLTFRLYDLEGHLQATRNDITLPAQGHLAQYVSGAGQLFPGVSNLRGRLVVTSSTTQIAALTLRQNAARSAPLTTLPAVSTSSTDTSFLLPQVANGGGDLGIKTQFILFSLGEAANVQLLLRNSDGQEFPVELSDGQQGTTFNLSVPAGGAVFVETDGTGQTTTGSALITSDTPIGMTAVFSLLNSEGAVTVEAGVGDSPVQSQFSLPVDLTSGFDTGVALTNPNDGTATAHFTFIRSSGTITQGPDVTIPHAGHVASFVSAMFPGLGSVQGQLSVRSDLPLAALSLRQQASTANLTTLPVVAGVADDGSGATPSNANLVRKQLQGVDLTADTSLSVQLGAGFKLSGSITFPFGYFPFGLVEAISPAGEVFTATPSGTILSGSYSLVVPAGSYTVRACTVGASVNILSSTGPAPASADEPIGATFVAGGAQNVLVDSDKTVPITVPAVTFHTVSGTIGNLAELPIDPSSRSVYFVLSSEESRTQAFAELGTGGAFSTQIGDGPYTATLVYGDGQDLNGDGIVDQLESATVLWNIGSVNVDGADVTGLTFNVPDLANLSGQVSQPQTTDFSNATASALNLSFPQHSIVAQCFPLAGDGASFAKVAANGTYDLTIRKNVLYDVLAAVPATEIGTANEGIVAAPLPGSARSSFSQDQNTLDLAVPSFPATVTVSGSVTGPTGSPVAGASLTFTTVGGLVGEPNATYSASTQTNGSGAYSITLLAGSNYAVEVVPPLQ